jgi:hypothetical protein
MTSIGFFGFFGFFWGVLEAKLISNTWFDIAGAQPAVTLMVISEHRITWGGAISYPVFTCQHPHGTPVSSADQEFQLFPACGVIRH